MFLFYAAIVFSYLVFDACCFFRLQHYTADTALAVIVDKNTTLKINTEHLRDISFRTDSIYQFIGELRIQPDNEVVEMQ